MKYFLNKLKNKTDIVVLLTHQGADKDVEMAKKLKDVEEHTISIIKLISQSENFNSLIKDPTNKQEDQLNVINLIFEKFIFLFFRYLSTSFSKVVVFPVPGGPWRPIPNVYGWPSYSYHVLLFSKKFNLSITEIFQKFGEEVFRNVETLGIQN